jgi:hypothetical protein
MFTRRGSCIRPFEHRGKKAPSSCLRRTEAVDAIVSRGLHGGVGFKGIPLVGVSSFASNSAGTVSTATLSRIFYFWNDCKDRP